MHAHTQNTSQNEGHWRYFFFSSFMYRASHLVGEGLFHVGATAALKRGRISHRVRLGTRTARILKRPRQRGRCSAIGSQTGVDLVLESSVGTTVNGGVLWEDIDGLVAQSAESVGENMSRVAILHTVIVQHSGIALGATGGISSVVQVLAGDGHTRG
jgi:hypothetical protein